MNTVLCNFTHGLGDSVQFTAVLQHLRRFRPDWKLYLRALTGKHTVGRGYCEMFWSDKENPTLPAFDQTFDIGWYENYNKYDDCPNSKVTNCLREVFKIEPVEELLRYKLNVRHEVVEEMDRYFQSIGCRKRDDGRWNACVIHYEGNTSPSKKNLGHSTVRQWCERLIDLDVVPVILDWDHRSPLPDNRTIFNPGVGDNDIWGNTGTGDAERITALISRAALMIGVDSGPQKCAGATDTPTIAVWVKHDPMQFYDLSPNVIHLYDQEMPDYHVIREPKRMAYFQKHYRSEPYVASELFMAVEKRMSAILRSVSGKHVDEFVVGIPTLNNYDDLDETIRAIYMGTAKPKRVIVIDNGGSYQPFKVGLAEVDVVRPSRNIGVAASWNILMKMAEPYEIVIMNDDLRVSDNVLAAVLAHPADCAMAAGFACFRLRQAVYNEIGEFDDTYWPAYFEDNDYARRMRLAGKSIAETDHNGVTHSGSSSIKRMSPSEKHAFDQAWNKNRLYYLKKWGGEPDKEVFVTPFAVPGSDALAGEYGRACTTPSDVWEHVATLRLAVLPGDRVIQFGTHCWQAVAAFAMAGVAAVCVVDDPLSDDVKKLDRLGAPVEVLGLIESPLGNRFDVAFIDGEHTAQAVGHQLCIAAACGCRKIILHDTATFGERGEDNGAGIRSTVNDFCKHGGGKWEATLDVANNNGLMVLERAES